MKKLLTLLLTLLAADICAAEKPLIRIHTDQTDLLYRIDDQGRLCQSYLGPAFRSPEDLRLLLRGCCLLHLPELLLWEQPWALLSELP